MTVLTRIMAGMVLTGLTVSGAATPSDQQRAIDAGAGAAQAVSDARADGTLPEAMAVFDPARNATADVDAALERAAANGKSVLLVMGGSWCHDSMTLVDLFASERFRAMMAPRYELVWVDVGHRDRNLDIARRFGLAGVEGTPTVLILSPDGVARNLEDAPRWRNAASRKADAIYRYFLRAAEPVWVAE